MSCITSVSYQIILNGQFSSPFSAQCGIRQGDPLSPYLYILAANVFSSLIVHYENLNEWDGIKICRFSKPVSHLLYADDSILFFECSEMSILAVKRVLDTNCSWFGQRINNAKSNIVFSPNVSVTIENQISQFVRVNITERVGKYLGTWIDNGRNKEHIYNEIVDSVQRRISSWKGKLLSQASRLTLVKFVLSSANIHHLSCFKLPLKYCKVIDSICIDFFWGNNDGKKRMHLIHKEALFTSKKLVDLD